MDSLMNPEVEPATLFPEPPQGEMYAELHRHLCLLRPVLTGWHFDDLAQPGIGFSFTDGFTGTVQLVQEEFVVSVYTGKCPMDAQALRMMLRHKATRRWMTWGITVEGGVLIFLSSRFQVKEDLGDLGHIILTSMEVAWKQRAEINIWISRLEYAAGQGHT